MKSTSIVVCFSLLALLEFSRAAQAQEDGFWDKRKVELEERERITPVVVAIWDTGIDLSVFDKRNIWTNSLEKADGTDTDGNGFIDDVHGIAFDLEEKPNSNLLMPRLEGLTDKELVELSISSKGNRDALFGVDSDEAKAAFKSSADSTHKENRRAAERLTWFGEYAHGTSMADVCVRGNPFIRIMAIRQQLSHRPPRPTVEGYENRAIAYEAAVRYMKENSVRVANLSWSRWPEFFEKIQAEHGMGGSKDERKKLAAKLYRLEHDALLSAIKRAPNILFVTSSRNMTNLSRGGALPQSLELPNIIRAGAADEKGNRMLTPRNAAVDVFAHANKVVAKTPGGVDVLTMGTSVAAAQVTNLAAKLLAVNENLSPEELKSIILKTSTPNEKRKAILLVHPQDAIAAAQRMAN